MKDLYLVDGYNVIFGRPDIFDRSDLESCRKKLMDIMQDYGAHNDIEVIIAFDGKGNSTKVKVEELSAFFTIVYTPRRMTADSYIEKESYLRRDEYRHIFVVTSDGPEQSQILGNGAYPGCRFRILCGPWKRIRRCSPNSSPGITIRISEAK